MPPRRNPVSRMFAAISLFIAQILDELRKVVRPTRQELTTYTTVVIVFVGAMMAYVFGLDQIFVRVVSFVFGSGGG
jgi:preprotein translocase subunit SecE|nr:MULTISPECIES: preprotein translocase subunit SecE [Intrasporangiaceae]